MGQSQWCAPKTSTTATSKKPPASRLWSSSCPSQSCKAPLAGRRSKHSWCHSQRCKPVSQWTSSSSSWPPKTPSTTMMKSRSSAVTKACSLKWILKKTCQTTNSWNQAKWSSQWLSRTRNLSSSTLTSFSYSLIVTSTRSWKSKQTTILCCNSTRVTFRTLTNKWIKSWLRWLDSRRSKCWPAPEAWPFLESQTKRMLRLWQHPLTLKWTFRPLWDLAKSRGLSLSMQPVGPALSRKFWPIWSGLTRTPSSTKSFVKKLHSGWLKIILKSVIMWSTRA